MTHQSIDDIISQEKHRRFTNRETELDLFERLVLLSDSPLRILGIHGSAGVGKTELLAEFKILCKRWEIPYLSIDGYAQKNILTILNRLRVQAGRHISQSYFSDFDRYISLHLRMQRTIRKEEDLITEFIKALDRGWQAAVDSSQTETAISRLRESYDSEDIDFYLRAESFLTENLLQSLTKVEATRWVFFIDAYEMLRELDDWVQDNLVRKLPEFFRVVIAGRRKFNPRWQGLRPVFQSIQLLAFGEEDTERYLRMHGVTQEDLVEEIFQLTSGHPLYLAMAACAKEDNAILPDADVVKDDKYLVIRSIIESILESIEDAVIRKAVEICAVVRFFDEGTLRYFISEDLPSGLLDKLQQYPFVKRRSYGFSLHDAVWEDRNTELRQRNSTLFRRMNERAISYYRERIKRASIDEWQRYAIETLYHQMAIDPREGLSFLVETFSTAEAQYRLDFCEALIREAQTRESAKLQDWLAFLKARLANLRDDWEEARAIFERLLRNRLLPTELGAYVLDGLGRVYYRLGEIGKAESVYSQALEAYKEAGRERGEAEVLYQLAKIDIAQRKWSAAKSKLEECVARFDKVSEDASKESWSEPLRGAVPAVERARASVLSSLGWIYLIQGYWDQALDKYSEALEMFQKLQDDYGAGCSLYQVGWALQQKGKWDEAVECYRQSREILADLGANYRVARTIVKLADVYRVQGRLEESEEVYLECMRICIRLKAELGIAVVLDSLGCLYQAQGLLRKAEIVHNKSFARKQDISFPFEIELTWMNLADLRVKQGEIDQALEYYGESLKLMQSMENKHGEALILLKMCEAAAMSQREISRATDWMKRAETLAEKYQYPEIQCRIHRLRGDRFVSEGDYESAIREYQRALQRAQDFNEYIYQDIHQSLLARSAEWPDVPQAIKLRELLDESL